MSLDRERQPQGARGGASGQFAPSNRADSATVLSTSLADGVDREEWFGPQGKHVQAFLDRVSDLSELDARSLAAQAPQVTWSGGSTMLFAPAGDIVEYWDLERVRFRVRAEYSHVSPGERHHEVGRVLVAGRTACDRVRLRAASADAVQDAAMALVMRDQISAHAYDLLTRTVRLSLGRIHPDDPDRETAPDRPGSAGSAPPRGD